MSNKNQIYNEFNFNQKLLEKAIDLLKFSRKHKKMPVQNPGNLDLPLNFPENGFGSESALTKLYHNFLDSSSQLHHPGFMAHMDPPTPSLVWAMSLWQVAMNQNQLHFDTSPNGQLISERVLNWLAPIYGMSGGHFVSGSTIANLTALWVARKI